MTHKPFVASDRSPVITGLLFNVITTSVALKNASQPWSHNLPMDNNDVSCNAGMMCALVASFGKVGMSNSAVCVDVMIVLLAVLTCLGRFAVRLFFTGSVGVTKVSFAPVSAMIMLAGGLGVTGDTVLFTVAATMLFVSLLFSCAAIVDVFWISLVSPSSPPSQLSWFSPLRPRLQPFPRP